MTGDVYFDEAIKSVNLLDIELQMRVSMIIHANLMEYAFQGNEPEIELVLKLLQPSHTLVGTTIQMLEELLSTFRKTNNS